MTMRHVTIPPLALRPRPGQAAHGQAAYYSFHPCIRQRRSR